MNKIDVSLNGHTLFTSGLGGSARYEMQSGKFVLAAKKDAPRMVQIKASKHGQQLLIAQEASNNHILGLDGLLVPVGKIEAGTKEEGEGTAHLIK